MGGKNTRWDHAADVKLLLAIIDSLNCRPDFEVVAERFGEGQHGKTLYNRFWKIKTDSSGRSAAQTTAVVPARMTRSATKRKAAEDAEREMADAATAKKKPNRAKTKPREVEDTEDDGIKVEPEAETVYRDAVSRYYGPTEPQDTPERCSDQE